MRKQFELVCEDGSRLYARAFTAEHPRAVVCLAHGLGEHGDRYRELASRLNAQGIALYVHDQRGHGRSVRRPSERGRARMKQLEADLLGLIELAQRETGLPVFVMGHSMGGLIGLYTVLHAKPPVRGAIITSPWLKLASGPPDALFGAVGALGGLVAPLTVGNGLSASALSHDEEICAEYAVDPCNHDRISLALAGDAHRAARWVLAHPEELTLPLLLCHGDADPICSVEGSRAFAARAKGVQYVEFPGAYHELHHEPGAQEKLVLTECSFIDSLLEKT